MLFPAETRGQSGFSLMELMVATTVMLIMTASALTFMKGSLKTTLTTYELTEAKENARTAQEFINRDLTSGGDGLRNMGNICLRVNFVTNYLSRNPNNNPCGAGALVHFPLVQSDDNLPANVAVRGTNPAVNVRTNPTPTDRMTLLQNDPSVTPIGLALNAVTNAGLNVRVPAANINDFNVGEIWFFTSSDGATFGTITAKNAAASTLTFANGDVHGMNQTGVDGPLSFVSRGGTISTSVRRMRIIHYFVNQNGLLIRRVFGMAGGGFTDSVIAEHITDLQFRYVLAPAASGLGQQPVAQLTVDQQGEVRQVEVSVTAETVHPLADGKHHPVSMKTTTSVRNFQFMEATQP